MTCIFKKANKAEIRPKRKKEPEKGEEVAREKKVAKERKKVQEKREKTKRGTTEGGEVTAPAKGKPQESNIVDKIPSIRKRKTSTPKKGEPITLADRAKMWVKRKPDSEKQIEGEIKDGKGNKNYR